MPCHVATLSEFRSNRHCIRLCCELLKVLKPNETFSCEYSNFINKSLFYKMTAPLNKKGLSLITLETEQVTSYSPTSEHFQKYVASESKSVIPSSSTFILILPIFIGFPKSIDKSSSFLLDSTPPEVLMHFLSPSFFKHVSTPP